MSNLSLICLGIIIAFVIAEFVLNRWLTSINLKHTPKQLPEEIADVYDADSYAKHLAYKKAYAKVGTVSSWLKFIFTFAMLSLGGYALLDYFAAYLQPTSDWLFDYPNIMNICYSLTFFFLIYLISTIIDLPFDIHDTFVIEEKFGFNKTTKKTFILDNIKSFFLNALLLGVLLAVVEFIYLLVPDYFWILAFAVIAAFSIFLNMFYTSLIVPIFNKQTPLQAGELRDAIEDFAKKVNFNLSDIYVMDSSKRSTKANAYFSGLGPKKRIVLYDTLIQQMTTQEIVAVLSHEIGHYKHGHMKKSLVTGLATQLLMTFLLGLFLGSDTLAQSLNGFVNWGDKFDYLMAIEGANFHINLIAFSLLYTPISFFISWGSNTLSRRHEYQADAFAAQHGMGDTLISALKKLSKSTLSNLTPHPLYVSFNYNHPTLLQRIQAIKKAQGK